MSTFAILVGFALMLFLPCALTVLGNREASEDSVYADRIVEPIMRARVAQVVQVAAAPAQSAEAAKPASKPASEGPDPRNRAEVSDPIVHHHAYKTRQARIQRNEIEALVATAAAARAQADALAANARLAAAKAEAADAEASDAEEAAAAAIHEMRRAA